MRIQILPLPPHIYEETVRLQFNGADRYAELEEGATYDFTLIGFRIGLFSMFPNIIAAKEIVVDR